MLFLVTSSRIILNLPSSFDCGLILFSPAIIILFETCLISLPSPDFFEIFSELPALDKEFDSSEAACWSDYFNRFNFDLGIFLDGTSN